MVDAVRAEIDPARWPPTVIAPAAFGSEATPALPGALDGHLIFASTNGIEIATGDGRDRHVLVPAQGMTLGEPSVNAEYHLLVFTRSHPPPSTGTSQPQQPIEVWVLDTGTGSTSKVVDDGTAPVISPDARWIAYSHRGHTYSVHPDGTGVTDIGEGECPVWSPDSSQLAICTNDNAVFLLRVSDRVRHSVVTGNGPNEPTSWSPDGTMLALISQRDGNGEIYLVDIAGGHERRLTNDPGSQAGAPWTHAGLLVTVRRPGQNSAIGSSSTRQRALRRE